MKGKVTKLDITDCIGHSHISCHTPLWLVFEIVIYVSAPPSFDCFRGIAAVSLILLIVGCTVKIRRVDKHCTDNSIFHMIHKCERSSLQAWSCWDSGGAYIWFLFSLNFYDPPACWRWLWREIIYHWISSGTRGLLSGTFRGPGDFQLSTLPYRTWRLLSFEGTLDHVAAIRLKRANVTHLSERFLGHVFVI